MKLPKELDHARKGLINVHNIDDNECFKLCLVRYLNPVDHHSARVTKADTDFAKEIDFKDIKFPVKVGELRKIETKNSIGISVLVIKMRKNIQFIYQKNVVKKKVLIYY